MADGTGTKRRGGWLGRLLAGEHGAFAEFVDRYKETVFLCCRTLGLREDEAEDVASETFLAAYKGIKRYKGRAQLSTWLWRIAYRQGVNYLRKKKRRRQLVAKGEGQLAASNNAQMLTAVKSKEQAELVWRAIEHLPRLWAVAIILFYREEKSISELAKIMRKRENTVKTYLFRGRRKLKELLADVAGENINA